MQQSITQKIIIQRFYSLLLNSLGEMLTINLISGDIIEGLLHSIDPNNNEYFILINPRRLSRTGIPIFLKESKLKIFFKDITSIHYEEKYLLSLPKNNFETDFQISKRNSNFNQKAEKLIKYEVDEGDKNIYKNKSLDDEINFKNYNEKWDQFEVNKIKYNIISTYDELLYTTALDKNKISKELYDYADKICNEIKNSTNNEEFMNNLEDKDLIKDKANVIDEEIKYSTIIKNQNNIKNEIKKFY